MGICVNIIVTINQEEEKNMKEMSANTKLEIAVEIMAAKIAKTSRQKKNISKLLEERNEMYKGNEAIINKIIQEYGPEIKKNYKEI